MKKKNLVFTIIAIVSLILMVIAVVLNNKASIPMALVGATSLFVLGILTWVVKKDNSIFRIIVLTALYVLLLSWIIPASMFYGTSVEELGMNRMSLYSVLSYPYSTFMFYSSFQALLFVLTVGGFYGILEKTGKYRSILERIAKSLKGNEILFLGVITFLFTVLSSVFGLNLILFIFIPAIVAILLLLGFDKITAFVAAFASPIIGIIGSTYSSNVSLIVNAGTGSEIADGFIYKIAVLVLTFAVYLFFLIRHAKKNKNKMNEVKEQLELSILGEKTSSKKPAWPLVVTMIFIFVVMVLGYASWEGAFKTTFFSDLFTDLTSWEIKGHTVLGYLLTNASAFGNWSYEYYGTFNYQHVIVLLVFASIILSLVYNIKLSDAFESFGKGAKKVIKPALLVAFAYTLLFVNGNHTVLVTIVEYVLNLFKNATGFLGGVVFVVLSTITTTLSTLMHIDTYYVVQSTTVVLNYHFADYSTVLNVLTTAIHGLSMLFVPTSSIMILGLSYLGISYKEWMKSSWKMLLALLGAILLVVILMMIITL